MPNPAATFVTDCDYCGHIKLCHNDPYGGTSCTACAEKNVTDNGGKAEWVRDSLEEDDDEEEEDRGDIC